MLSPSSSSSAQIQFSPDQPDSARDIRFAVTRPPARLLSRTPGYHLSCSSKAGACQPVSQQPTANHPPTTTTSSSSSSSPLIDSSTHRLSDDLRTHSVASSNSSEWACGELQSLSSPASLSIFLACLAVPPSRWNVIATGLSQMCSNSRRGCTDAVRSVCF